MKRIILLLAIYIFVMATNVAAQVTPQSQMEQLDRGVVALKAATGTGNFVSWRFLGTDADNTTFDLLRNGELVASDLTVTNYVDKGGNAVSEYSVVTKADGQTVDTSEPVKAWGDVYLKLKLERPADGADYSYTPNDMSVGDVDGDGQYELFVKWDPSNAKDNSQNGVTGIVYIDCYKMDRSQSSNCQLLWRIDLGKNIRAGAHYTQFQVYDYDGDGRAEMMCKTAPGSKDGLGNYVNQAATNATIQAASNTKSWVNASSGRIDGGHEYLTVFDGETGAAIHTIAYYPNRNAKAALSEAAGSFNWDDRSGKSDKGSYGNRGERYLAATAYLDGPDSNPSAIFCRGYYTFAYVWAVDFDGEQLTTRWLHQSDTKTTYKVLDANGQTTTYRPTVCTSGMGRYTMYANGNHNMSIGDVDGDGKDEIIWGSAALDDDGKMLYAVGFGHGDAIHLGDLDPDRPGLELFDIHEEKGTYAWDLHDAATGEIIAKGGPSGVDNGRGMAGHFDSNHREALFSSAADRNQRSAATGEVVSSGQTSLNFRIFWDGDLQEELLDGTKIDKWTGSTTKRLYINGKNPYDYNASSSCNGTKSTPNLQADLFGDWREEIILWSTSDNATLNVIESGANRNYRKRPTINDEQN